MRYFRTSEVVKALFDAVKDPDYLVRDHACESLLFFHGFKPDIAEYEEIFQNIIKPVELGVLPTKEDINGYEQAIQQLKKLFQDETSTRMSQNSQKR